MGSSPPRGHLPLAPQYRAMLATRSLAGTCHGRASDNGVTHSVVSPLWLYSFFY